MGMARVFEGALDGEICMAMTPLGVVAPSVGVWTPLNGLITPVGVTPKSVAVLAPGVGVSIPLGVVAPSAGVSCPSGVVPPPLAAGVVGMA